MSNISSKIKERRLELGMTLEEVGNIVGVGKSTVRKWETGQIENMRRDKIALLAKALRVSPAFIMGWEEEKKTTDPEIGGLDENVSMYLSLNEDHKAAVDRIIQELYSIESGD